MRTPQDIINRKEANQRYYKLEENKQDIKRLHEEWAKENGYRDNDMLHVTNTERLVKDAKK